MENGYVIAEMEGVFLNAQRLSPLSGISQGNGIPKPESWPGPILSGDFHPAMMADSTAGMKSYLDERS